MKKTTTILFSFFALSACNSKDKEQRILQELSEKTFTTTSYNYTKNDIYSITFKEARLPFKIDEAPGGGSIFFRDGNQLLLDDGTKVSFNDGNCCFIWDGPIDKPLRVRVVWSVVYDTSYHNGKSSVYYDERSSRESAPGTRWCQAIVDIQPSPARERPTVVFLHFLTDGSVQAHLGTFQNGGALTSQQVKLHSEPLPPHQFCKEEIENPFYGIPRKPHME